MTADGAYPEDWREQGWCCRECAVTAWYGMSLRDLRSLLVALGLLKPRPRRYRPGEARLPRIAYAEEAAAAYVRRGRRRTRRLFPVVVLLVVLRSRSGKHQRRDHRGRSQMNDISPREVYRETGRWFGPALVVGLAVLVLAAILTLVGWQVGWWFTAQNATRQYQVTQNGYSNQDTLRAQVTSKLADVTTITTQIAATKDAAARWRR